MRYQPISSDLFSKNRKKILSALPADSIVILCAADKMPRNGDLMYPYRQSSDFFYMSGIEQEDSFIVLLPGETDEAKQAILFLREVTPDLEIWEGKKLSYTQAQEISGISDIRSNKEMILFISTLLSQYKHIYLNRNENPRFSANVLTRELKLWQFMKKKYGTRVQSVAPIFSKMRMRKEKEEIELIRKACFITQIAFTEVLPFIKPGMHEYEIEAKLTEVFLREGAEGHAFEPIIASGINSCFLHYSTNSAIIKPNDMVLLDFGSEYANYASDCSRTIPANGVYSKNQKMVYKSVLRTLKHAKSFIKPGVTILDIQKHATAFITEELNMLGLIDLKNNTHEKPYYKYFMHGISHFMGLDTHDVGAKDDILEPGMIITCEPGIYVPDWGFGIRLENDILVTENGNEDLMDVIPIELDQIESIMN